MLDACIQENLRLMTPAHFTFTRIAKNDIKLGDVIIKKGT